MYYTSKFLDFFIGKSENHFHKFILDFYLIKDFLCSKQFHDTNEFSSDRTKIPQYIRLFFLIVILGFEFNFTLALKKTGMSLVNGIKLEKK
jgi:hypothetical protein